MTLAALMARDLPRLRCELMREYGLNLDKVMTDGTTAAFVADLAAGLPSVAAAQDPDAAWGLRDVLLAFQVNQLTALLYGLGGAKGSKPGLIGPKWLIDALNPPKMRVLPIEELEKRLREFDERARGGVQATTIVNTY